MDQKVLVIYIIETLIFQITQLPRGIKGVYLHHEQIGSEREAALKRIMDKDVSVVLMTPEQLMKRIYQSSSHFSLYRFPPIAFVCFDEVHLISENDRPSYRRLFKVHTVVVFFYRVNVSKLCSVLL